MNSCAAALLAVGRAVWIALKEAGKNWGPATLAAVLEWPAMALISGRRTRCGAIADPALSSSPGAI